MARLVPAGGESPCAAPRTHQIVASPQERENPCQNRCAAVPARDAACRFACWRISARARVRRSCYCLRWALATHSAFPVSSLRRLSANSIPRRRMLADWPPHRSGRDGAPTELAPSNRSRRQRSCEPKPKTCSSAPARAGPRPRVAILAAVAAGALMRCKAVGQWAAVRSATLLVGMTPATHKMRWRVSVSHRAVPRRSVSEDHLRLACAIKLLATDNKTFPERRA